MRNSFQISKLRNWTCKGGVRLIVLLSIVVLGNLIIECPVYGLTITSIQSTTTEGECDSFRIRTNNGIIVEPINSRSASWGDYDNDGYDDLFVPENDMRKPNQLYHNNGDGTFTRITSGAIVTDLSSSVMGEWGDYNNDGFLDLFVGSNVMPQNLLYENNGDGTFKKITESSLIEMGAAILDADWTDYNRDGFLDIIATDYNTNSPNHLYRGDGKGNFTLDSFNIICRSRTTAVGTAWCDYDQDGDIDLFIANTHGQNNQLFNNDNGNFVEIREGAIVNDGGHSVDCAWGDMDNDGDMDLYVVNSRTFEKNNLYRNDGNGQFTKIIGNTLVNNPANSNEAEWVDFDNDGFLDLYVANDQNQENHLYKNNGNISFTKEENLITTDKHDSYGCSWSDMDRDGDLDLYVPNTFSQTNDFYQNETDACSDNNYLDIRLIGCASNSFGLGSQIRLLCTINGTKMWQTKDVDFNNTGTSTHFGLGNATNIDSLVVLWPSGLVSELSSTLDVNRSHIIREDCEMKIEGHVFWDENFNGVKDEEEKGLANHRILVTPGNFWTFTDSAGNYATYVEEGTYAVRQSTSGTDPIYQTFPEQNRYYTVTLDPQVNFLESNLDFGVTNICGTPDLSINLDASVLNREEQNEYTVKIYNRSTHADAGAFKLQLDLTTNAVLQNTNHSSVTTEGDRHSYIFDFESLAIGDSISMNVQDLVRNASAKSDTIQLWASILYDFIECDKTNNHDSIYTLTKDALDNSKSVEVNTEKGATEGLHTYIITYQNIGLNPATYVRIVDTLSEYLDWTTFETISTTHDFKVSRSKNRITWIADNIYLPTKGQSPTDSKGQIVFSIYPKENVKKTDRIFNTAFITMNSDLPVRTNTVESSFKYGEGHVVYKDVVLLPNPTHGIFEVKLKNDKDFNEEIKILEIIDSRGRVVHSFKPTEIQPKIDITYMPAAVYVLKIQDIYDNVFYTKFIKD